jgi:WD40 repeat protein
VKLAHVFHKPHMFLLCGSNYPEAIEGTGAKPEARSVSLPLISLKPTDLVLYNAETHSMQAQIFFTHAIKRVDFTKKIILVEDVEGTVHVYCALRFKPLVSLELGTKIKRNLHISTDTAGNQSYLVIQNQDDSGSVSVFDVNQRKFASKIQAHTSKIHKVCLSEDGNYLACCSEKGTTIKLFSLKTGELVKKFRMGLLKQDIKDISFSRRSEFVVCVSKSHKVTLFEVK